MIAIVIPTIRPELFNKFLKAWQPLFDKHSCELVVVQDGEKPTVNGKSAEEVMGTYASSLTNFNAGIRNLGFAYVAKELKDCDIIITLDDDVIPMGDPIQDHINALNSQVPVSWISTASQYTRGFPYSIRSEAEVVISHGVWEGSGDWDAPTRLVLGENIPTTYYKGPIPKGIYYPMCSMNLAFKRKMLPYIFHAPWALGINRFDDIFAGIVSKREIDKLGWAVVSGYSTVYHQRASNPIQNLKDEAFGIALNESFWKGDNKHPYFAEYEKKYKVWQEFIKVTEGFQKTEAETETERETEHTHSQPAEVSIVKTEEAEQEFKGEIKVEIIAESSSETPIKQGILLDENTGELNFWQRWLEANGKYFATPRRLSRRFHPLIGDKKEVVVANLGAGAMNTIGHDLRNVAVRVISSDILADEYNKMCAELGVYPVDPVEKQDMENLTYENDSFDIVYCGNSLDHTKNPRKALMEMIRICKPGGYIYLRHIAHEGKRHLYRGLHRWNIDITENGDCKFWTDKKGLDGTTFFLSEIYPGFKNTIEIIPKGALITSIVQKQ